MKQTIKPKARGGEDAIRKTVGTIGKVSLGVLSFGIWLGVASALNGLIASHMVRSFPPDTLLASPKSPDSQLWPFLLTLNLAFAFCLALFFWANGRTIRSKLTNSAIILAAFMASLVITPPAVLHELGESNPSSWGGVSTVISAVSALLLLALGVSVARTLFVEKQSLLQNLKQRAVLLMPAILVIASALAAYATRSYPSEQTVHFEPLFLQGMVAVTAFSAILLLALFLSSQQRAKSVFFTLSTFVVLTGITAQAARIAHNSGCIAYRNALSTMQSSSTVRDYQPGIVDSYHAKIQHECGSAYDLELTSTAPR